MSDVVEGTAAESEAAASIVNRWMAGIAVVDGAACLGGGHLLELVRTRNAELHHCAIPATSSLTRRRRHRYFGEPSSFFDFAESLPPCLMNRFN